MRAGILTLLFSILLMAGPAAAAEFTPSQRTEMESIISDYLLEHPELLKEMSQRLEEKEKLAETEQRKSALVSESKSIFHDKADFVAGNAKAKTAMVEFFDYNCGWCKKGFPEVYSLMDADKNLRVVLKEFPIFGEDSEYAATAALAANKQGKYWALHIAMFSHDGKITKAAVDDIAQAQGLDMIKLKKDMSDPAIVDTLMRNRALAQTLAINGTPAFVIGDKVVPGYLPQDELAATIEDVRARGGCSLC
jgi:protein-disulfide isomerase